MYIVRSRRPQYIAVEGAAEQRTGYVYECDYGRRFPSVLIWDTPGPTPIFAGLWFLGGEFETFSDFRENEFQTGGKHPRPTPQSQNPLTKTCISHAPRVFPGEFQTFSDFSETHFPTPRKMSFGLRRPPPQEHPYVLMNLGLCLSSFRMVGLELTSVAISGGGGRVPRGWADREPNQGTRQHTSEGTN